MAGRGNTGGRYRPAQARPTTLEELRQYVWQELQQIGGAIDAATESGLALCDDVVGGLVVDGDLLDYKPDISKWCAGRRTRFIPAGYVQGQTYQRGDEVANGSQISECLVDGATESPYITPTGAEIQGYNGTLVAQQDNVRQIVFGQRYAFGVTAYINTIRVYTYPGQTYTIEKITDPINNPQIETLAIIPSATEGWVEVNSGTLLVQSGSVFDIVAIIGDLGGSPNQTDWASEVDYYNPQPYPQVTVNGVISLDGAWADATIDSNAYGIDITAQPAYIPTQWWVKVLASGGIGGGGGGGGVIPTRPIVIFTALTTYNVGLGDENALICTTSDTPVAFVLPDGGLPAGFITHVHQYGLGQVTVSAVSPSVCVSSRSLVTRARHSALSVFNLGNGSYSVVGDQE